jgi:hypothetical protein
MSANNTDLGHGDSVAAWVTVSAIMLASVAGTAAVWFGSAALAIAGVALTVGGLLAGFLLKKAGYGVGGSKSKSSH